MKRILYPSLLVLIIFLITSCTNEETDVVFNNATNGNYFPSSIGNFWKYNVERTDNTTTENLINQDSLYVVAENAGTLMLDVNNGLPANGPIIGLLSSGTLTKTNTTLFLNGALELPTEISDLIDFNITLNNFVIYNVEAVNNTELASNTNTITQDFNGFPLTIDYQLTSTALGFNENINLNGVAYTNVTTSKLTLNLSASTTLTIAGFPISLTILDAQDILVSTNYFAKDIGLVYANSNTSYQINATAISALEAAGFTLPIPASGSTSIKQVIEEYILSE